MKLRHLCLAPLLLLGACSSGTTASPLDAVGGFVGSWQGSHELLGYDTVFDAGYEVRIEGDSMLWDFTSNFEGGFTGHAELLWDEARGQWAESWEDSSGAEKEWSYGDWDAATGTMISTSPGVDWMDPTVEVTVTNTTVLTDDQYDYVMSFTYPDGRVVEVMWIRMTRQ